MANSCGNCPTYKAGCPGCQKAGRDYARKRDRAIAAGTWKPAVPCTALRPHLRKLRAAGMSNIQIAAAAGCSHETIGQIMGTTRYRHPRKWTEGAVAAGILAVEPEPPRYGDLVPTIGTVRRLRAMARDGLWIAQQARAIGKPPRSIGGLARGSQWTNLGIVTAVRELYDRGSRNLPITPFAAAWAEAQHDATGAWWPRDAWDEDTIDDPTAEPYDWRGLDLVKPAKTAVSVSSVHVALMGGIAIIDELTHAERIEVVTILAARGWSDQQIGDHLCWGDTDKSRRINAQGFRRRNNIKSTFLELSKLGV